MRTLLPHTPLCTLVLLAGMATAAHGAAASTMDAPGQEQRPNAHGLPGVVAALSAQQITGRLGDGCWVRFYTDARFRGRGITLVGPVDLARLDIAGSRLADWSSAVVGPQATVTVFDQPGFRDPALTIGPGRRVPDLQAAVRRGSLAQARSINVDCVT